MGNNLLRTLKGKVNHQNQCQFQKTIKLMGLTNCKIYTLTFSHTFPALPIVAEGQNWLSTALSTWSSLFSEILDKSDSSLCSWSLTVTSSAAALSVSLKINLSIYIVFSNTLKPIVFIIKCILQKQANLIKITDPNEFSAYSSLYIIILHNRRFVVSTKVQLRFHKDSPRLQ